MTSADGSTDTNSHLASVNQTIYRGADIVTHIRSALVSRQKSYISDPSKKPSAVLLLLYPKHEEYHVMFTVRTSLVDDHKGEISFPGGAFHDGEDKSLLETAIRESFEEVGVLPENVEILGELDDMLTRSSYIISPFVGTLKQSQSFAPAEAEVAEIVEVPLRVLLSPDTVKYGESQPITYAGRNVPGIYYHHDDYVVWGATARMLTQFLDICFPPLNVNR